MDGDDELDDIIEVVAGFYGVPCDAVKSASRAGRIHWARCVAMYIAHNRGMAAVDIGRRFGGRDYSVVLDVCRKISSLIKCNAAETKLLKELQGVCEETIRRRHRPKQ